MKNLKLNSMAIILIPICIIVLIGCSSGPDTIKKNVITNPGAKVLIAMDNGEEYEGELLIVHDSTMILCEKYNASEKDLADSVFVIYTLKNHEIKLIEMKGKSNAIYGIIFGGLTGALIGISASKDNGKKEEKPDENSFNFNFKFGPEKGAFDGCCIGGFLGAMIGGIIGFIITDDEVVYEYANPEEYDFTQLNIYSRYSGEEPEYLKAIE